MKIKTKQIIFILGLSLFAAFLGRGLMFPRYFDSMNTYGILSYVHNDGWIEDKAEVSLSRIAGFGNQLSLKFDKWRPEGTGNALVDVVVCNKLAARFAVESMEPYVFQVRPSCNDAVAEIKIQNTFYAGPVDGRNLGVRLDKAKLTSPLGIPIVSFLDIFTTGFLIFVLSLGVFLLSSNFYYGTAVSIVALVLLARGSVTDLNNLNALFFLLISIISGVLLYRRSDNLGKSSSSFNISNGTWIILCIVIGGAVLRFYGLSFGLPGRFHPDETPKINAITGMISRGDFNPKYFLHPSLLLYCSLFVGKFYQLIGVPWEIETLMRLGGRTTSAIVGTASIAILYLVAKNLFNRSTGILSAAALAVFPLHVTCSRYMKEDALMLFFILLVTLFVVKAVKENRPVLILLAGIFAGLATGSKYSGFLSTAIIAISPWIVSRSWIPDKKFFLYGIGAAALVPIMFLCTTPYAYYTFESFQKGFNNEASHMQKGHTVAITAYSQYWMYHFLRSLIPGVNPIAAFVGLLGAGVLLVRRKWEDLFIVGLVLLFYMPAEWVRAKPAPQAERYILPCVPFFAVLVAIGIQALAKNVNKKLAYTLGILCLALPLTRTVQLALEVRDDTRTKMAEWINENIPHGSKILIDWVPYAPTLTNSPFQADMFPSGKLIPRMNAKDLKNSGYDYLILSSLVYNRFFNQPQDNPVRRAVFRRVFERVPIVKDMKPKYGSYGFHNPTLTLFSLKAEDFKKLEAELEAKNRGEIEKTSNEVKASFHWR